MLGSLVLFTTNTNPLVTCCCITVLLLMSLKKLSAWPVYSLRFKIQDLTRLVGYQLMTDYQLIACHRLNLYHLPDDFTYLSW